MVHSLILFYFILKKLFSHFLSSLFFNYNKIKFASRLPADVSESIRGFENGSNTNRKVNPLVHLSQQQPIVIFTSPVYETKGNGFLKVCFLPLCRFPRFIQFLHNLTHIRWNLCEWNHRMIHSMLIESYKNCVT
jgi:hypothetical protein